VNLQPVHCVGVSVFSKRNMGHVTEALSWTCTTISDVCNTTIRGQTGHKAHNFLAPLLGNRCCASLVGWSSSCQPATMKLIGLPITELPCDLDLWPHDLGVMSRDETWVINTCAKPEMYMIYCSRVRTTTILHWLPA